MGFVGGQSGTWTGLNLVIPCRDHFIRLHASPELLFPILADVDIVKQKLKPDKW
jgi:hypothetical protein